MQRTQQLSTLSAEKAPGQRPLERRHSESGAEGQKEAFPRTLTCQDSKSYPSSPSSVQKRTKKFGLPGVGPHLRPLPTIETIMTYRSISQPVYNSLLRGDPPVSEYDTVIHTPRFSNLPEVENDILRVAELEALGRCRRRPRSNTLTSSTSTMSHWSNSTESDDSVSTAPSSTQSHADEESEPTSPASTSSTSKATTASSPPATPNWSPVPVSVSPTASRSTESDIPDAHSSSASSALSYEPSATESFHTSLPSWSHFTSDHETSANSSRSLAPSPSSSAYPSPPSTPLISRHSSSGGEELFYPSPPPSPREQTHAQPLRRQRRAFSFPLDKRRQRTFSTRGSPYSLPLTRSARIKQRRSADSNEESGPLESDLGEAQLGNGSLFADEEDRMEWSMNGGRIAFADQEEPPRIDEHSEETVIYGAAGIALSPRLMKSCCCQCEYVHHGLGLYVIEEYVIEESVEDDQEEAVT